MKKYLYACLMLLGGLTANALDFGDIPANTDVSTLWSSFAFKTISVSGQSDVIADSTADTLTLVAGSNITIITNAGTDTVTISATGGGGTFLSLTDTPSSYSGQSLKAVRVNSGETALEFYTAGGGTPGGSDTQIQFNDSSVFGGDSDFTWNKTSNVLTDLGTLELGAASDTTVGRSSAGHISVEGSVVGLASDSLSFFTASTSNTIGVGHIELGHATDTTVDRNAAGVMQVEGVVVPTISSINTFTNKRNTKRALSTSGPGATPTINTDTYDVVHFTALATAITSMTTNLTGTPVQGDQLRIDFTDDGTARAIAWGTGFEDGGVLLPLTTSVSIRLDTIFYWNTVTSKWRCMAISSSMPVVSSLVASGSAVSLTNNTTANITSISLGAGDWDVSGNVNFTETTSTVTARSAGVTSTSATVPSDGSEVYCGVQSTVTSETNSITLARKRFSLSGTTTVYLVGRASFSAGTCAGFGQIVASRAP